MALAVCGALIAASVLSIRQYAAYFGTPFFDWPFDAGAVDRWLAGRHF